VTLRAGGAEVIGEVELAFRRRAVPIIGVTGTAGKGGTSSLIHDVLVHLGYGARLGGNFDPPLLDVVDGAEVAVAELSSFQLERVLDFRPVVAVITNLGVDHLDRHGTVEAYHAAKRHITRAQTETDVLVLPEGLSVESRARTLHFSASRIVLADGTEVAPLADLPDGHHPGNVAAAVLAVEAFVRSTGREVDASALRAALLAARPVPGRFETVARGAGLRFVDDSIATRTLAVRAALERAPGPVAWLIGGRDKGADLAGLVDVAREKVAHVVAFGEDGERFARAFGRPTSLVTSRDPDGVMREAVALAAVALGEGGGTVLLAPIGTSFDLYEDYKARGAAFTRAARALLSERAEVERDGAERDGVGSGA
jgi:UDP-N-acetylmuramoylalanine--D-glutamate ligase